MRRICRRRTRLTTFLVTIGFLAVGCVQPGAGPESELPVAQSLSSPETQVSGAQSSGSQPLRSQTATYLDLGARLLAANEPEMALTAFLESVRVDGLSAEALTGAGIAAQKQGMLTAARRYFDHARDLAPDSILAQNNLGVVLFFMKEYYPARDAFKVAYALSSGQSEIAERNLNRAELMVAEIEKDRQADPETSHRVVRLGTREFLITPTADLRPELIAAE